MLRERCCSCVFLNQKQLAKSCDLNRADRMMRVGSCSHELTEIKEKEIVMYLDELPSSRRKEKEIEMYLDELSVTRRQYLVELPVAEPVCQF